MKEGYCLDFLWSTLLTDRGTAWMLLIFFFVFRQSFHERQTNRLSFQNARLPIGAQLQPIRGGKGSFMVPVLLPVAIQEPVTRFTRMTHACPVYELLLHELVILAHACGLDDSVVIARPADDERVQFFNHLIL